MAESYHMPKGISPPQGRSRLSGPWSVLGLLLGIGLVLRLLTVWRLPLMADEVSVMAYGLAQAFTADNAQALGIEVPLNLSNGITPLWFWLQALPASLFGVTSKLGLRSIPVLLGLLSIVLAYRGTLAMFTGRSAWFAGLAMACMGLMLYNNSRGEFSESLMAPLLLLMLFDLYPKRDPRPIPWRVALWPGLILFTYFGKGVLVWGAYCGVLASLWALARLGWARPGRLTFVRMLVLVCLPLVPSLLWMATAQAVMFRDGPILMDFGMVTSVWDAVWKLTLGYGIKTKTFMVSSWHDALFPFTGFWIWPTLCILAPVLVGAWLLGLRDLFRGFRSRMQTDSEPTLERAVVCLGLSLPVFALVLYKGALGARFHVLYLIPMLPFAAYAFDRWLGMLERGKTWAFLAIGAPPLLFVSATSSWSDRLQGEFDPSRFYVTGGVTLAWFALITALASRPAWKARGARAFAVLASLLLVISSLGSGVMAWGQEYAWEPEPRNGAEPRSTSIFSNPDTFLTGMLIHRGIMNAEVQGEFAKDDEAAKQQKHKQLVQRYRPYLLRCIEAHPDDRGAMIFATKELYGFSTEDRGLAVAKWKEFLAQNPGDEDVQRLLQDATQ